MKKVLLALMMICGINAAAADSLNGGRFGLGLMVGTIVSGTGKYWISDKEAVDFGVGIASPAAVFYGDYLWRLKGLFGHGTRFGRETDAYIGGGGGLGFWSRSDSCGGYWNCKKGSSSSSGTVAFLRGLFGIEWYPGKPPLGVFAEVGPAIELVPETGGLVNVGVGCRYYF